ncbi:hypothetical protein ACFYPG_00590 [Micromonospora sp. NPDC005553]|uniref:hypothetical protein n=1 Tax=Micromonospora sp. NPDC005553 TaxID=3364232 RepID=UPI0036B7AD0F
MPIAILYFLAAGAVGGTSLGGLAAARFLYRRGQQKAAVHIQARDTAAIAQLLQEETGLAKVREQALAAGVDVDQVERGYRNLQEEFVTLEQVKDYLRALNREPDHH